MTQSHDRENHPTSTPSSSHYGVSQGIGLGACNAKQHEVLKVETALVMQQWTALHLAEFRQN
jgi:hypothetical protein